MRKLAALIIALGVLVGPSAAPGATKKRPRLKAFTSCSGLLSYARTHAARTVGDVFMGARPPARPAPMPQGGTMEDGAGGTPTASPAPQSPERASDFSTTNVQEEGVDEPDSVKTDGRTLFAVSFGKLHAVDVRSEEPKLLGSLDLPDTWGHELLLHGTRLLVISQGHRTRHNPQAGGGRASTVPEQFTRAATRLVEVDVSDPAAMKVLRTQEADGAYVSGRLNGATARIVVSSPPRVFDMLPMPSEPGDNVRAQQRRTVRRAGLSGFLPRARYHNRETGRRHTRRLASCGRVRRPQQFSGVDMLAVLTVDMEKGLPIADSDAVMTSAEIVYGGRRDLFIATQRYISPRVDTPEDLPRSITTAIHRFDSSERGVTHYRASGEVPGFLLSQWALSEHRGRLRVASTDRPTWFEDGQSQSMVTVLDERDGKLVEVGQVGGLGKGERIYAVRFIGDVGYVVTFRQVDPLYTIDLSDPTAPKVLGELKIEGYSAYLHPVADNLLLGVGQDATAEGRVQGTQLSLFDVSDLSNVKRVHQTALGTGSNSAVEWDHRAFLWWPPTSLAMIPVTMYSEDYRQPPFIGAIGFTVSRDEGIAELGRVRHPVEDYRGVIQRSLVVGDRVFTVSDIGVLASRLDTLAAGGFVQFPVPPDSGGPHPADGPAASPPPPGR